MLLLSLSTVVIAGIVSCYALYYIFRKVSKPQLSCGQGTFSTHLLEHCPILQQPYWPTCWAFNRHVMTIGRYLIQQKPHFKYKREIFTTPDEGELALDWYDTDYNDSHIKEDAPILLILPGLTSTSQNITIQWLVCDGVSQGYHPVVMNYRGCAGVPLKTLRGYCANSDDIGPVVNHLHKSCPNVPIVALGVSLGGLILVQHLIKAKEHCGLVAALTLSSPWNLHFTTLSLETKVNWLLYNSYLTNNLIKYIESNRAALILRGIVDSDTTTELMTKVRRSSSIKEFDITITVPMFGYNSVEEYYDQASNAGRLDQIMIPLVSVTATSDPFVPSETLPVYEFQANSNTMLVVTKNGGHVSFMEGWLPRGRTWMNRVTQEILAAIKKYPQKNIKNEL